MLRFVFLPAAVSLFLATPILRAQDRTANDLAFSGLVDVYYELNFNHPASRVSQLRNFDVAAGQFSLNMLKLTLERAAEPAGFRVDLGFGKAFEIIHAGEASPAAVRYVEQAYVSLKPRQAKGLQLDLGKFVTSAGAEVIETDANWNYSRSILFAWAIPYYHAGVRAAAPLGRFTLGAQLVNGWNNVEDNNTGKTIGLTGSFSAGGVSWSHAYYAGPEKSEQNRGRRHLYDTTFLARARKASFYLNFDYGLERGATDRDAAWYGVAGAARLPLNETIAVAPRLEWFRDRDGFSTGVPQTLKEFTLTAECKLAEGFIGRLEYRRDWSNEAFFSRGAGPALAKSQSTLLAGFVAAFGAK